VKLANWIVDQIIKEDVTIKKVVAIYPGRFQPMGAHHAQAFKWLQGKFKDAYIGTSNKVSAPKSPFSFSEKKKIISAYGLGSKLKQVRNPYKAQEILSKYDPETTAVVFMVGAKDASRLGGKFFRPWKGKAEVGYKEGAYTIIAPHVSMNVPGYGEMSGTTLRAVLGDTNLDKNKKEKIYKGIFGHTKNYDWIVKKLEKLNESIIEQFIVENDFPKIIKEASVTGASKGGEVDDGPSHGFSSIRGYKKSQTKVAEKMGFYVVKFLLAKGDGETILGNSDIPTPEDHAKDVKYPSGPITAVSYFPAGDQGVMSSNNQFDISTTAAYRKWKKHIKKISTAVGMQLINWVDSEEAIGKKNVAGDRIKEPNKPNPKITKIIKQNTKANKPVPTIKRSIAKLRDLSINEEVMQLISEGGAYGHMAHPFDDKGLTFGDLKNIIVMGLQGNLSRETIATEKTDGQNLFVTWNNGLKAARNAGDIKRGGVSSSDIASKFAGRGNIEKAFNYAMRDLGKAFGSINDKQKEKIFDNGNNWVNMEIIYPASANVINYDAPYLQFHNVLQYKNGSAIGAVNDGARILAGMIRQVNANVQKSFSIIGPNILKVKANQDFGKMKSKFIGKLNKIKSEFRLSDKDTLGMYHQKWWENFITSKSPSTVANDILVGLTKRWAFFDKSFRLNKLNIPNEKVLDWAKNIDKEKHASQIKKNMFAIETLFFEVGAEILSNASGFLAANPDKAVQDMKKQVDRAIAGVKAGGDPKKLARVAQQLEKISAIGGFSRVVPSEGIVFIYKGKTYKFTGAFAPVNQITGLFYM
tara:strand:+ start:1718 stop:4141 length:2424 start_codon:yes stop_codon:yes gene_type:complete